MSTVAVAFAVLNTGGSATELGYVLAAGVIPQVLFLLGGGVVADRIGRRPVMLAADVVRCGAYGALAIALFAGTPATWFFVVVSALRGIGDAFFAPALTGLTVELAPADELGNANALFGVADSASRVAGPALAGFLVAIAGARVIIAVDAVSYAISALALSTLRFGRPVRTGNTFVHDLANGFSEFKSRSWLLVTTIQFTFFNLIVWGPFLLLGPVLAKQHLGGARAWGIIMAVYGLGAVFGGILALGRRPRKPVAVAAIATFGYPLPSVAFALGAPTVVIAAAALLAGIGSAGFLTFWYTALQQQVPSGALARVDAFVTVGAYTFGPVAFAAAGPIAAAVGARTVLGVGAVWSIASSMAVFALPAVRSVTWRSSLPDDDESLPAAAGRG
jgi:MFS family permease